MASRSSQMSQILHFNDTIICNNSLSDESFKPVSKKGCILYGFYYKVGKLSISDSNILSAQQNSV